MVEGKSSNAKQGARQGQALSRMMVVDHSVRMRCPQALDGAGSDLDGAVLLTCSGGVATSEGTVHCG